MYTALCSVYNTMEECAVNVALCECLCVFRHMRQYNSRTYTPNPLYSNPNSILYHNKLRDSAAHDQFYAASSSSCSTSLPEELLKKHFAIVECSFRSIRLLLHSSHLWYDGEHDKTYAQRWTSNGDRNDQRSQVILYLCCICSFSLLLWIYGIVNEANTNVCSNRLEQKEGLPLFSGSE